MQRSTGEGREGGGEGAVVLELRFALSSVARKSKVACGVCRHRADIFFRGCTALAAIIVVEGPIKIAPGADKDATSCPHRTNSSLSALDTAERMTTVRAIRVNSALV